MPAVSRARHRQPAPNRRPDPQPPPVPRPLGVLHLRLCRLPPLRASYLRLPRRRPHRSSFRDQANRRREPRLLADAATARHTGDQPSAIGAYAARGWRSVEGSVPRGVGADGGHSRALIRRADASAPHDALAAQLIRDRSSATFAGSTHLSDRPTHGLATTAYTLYYLRVYIYYIYYIYHIYYIRAITRASRWLLA